MNEELTDEQTEAMFEKAQAIADKHLEAAMNEAGEMAPFLAVSMIEAAVNAAVDIIGAENVIEMLRDLAQQIEDDSDEDDA